MSSKAVSKENAEEKVGIFIEESERLRVLEYSDLPNNLINAKNKNGSLKFDLGNIAIHMFSRDFIEKLTRALPQSKRLPYHAAHKKVPYLDEKGRLRAPNQTNGIKAEMFVFDALPLAQNNQILKVSRSEEFAPIKNAFGADSIKSSIKLQLARSQVWQGAAGGTHLKGDVEISPLYAPTQAYFIEEYTRGTSFNLKKTNKGTLWRPTP
jgi:UDP-N-acetylglucosamine/UDP-N-acetylgalactosamine diphosphorylase